MEAKRFDWKDVAGSQFDKALALALALVLLAIMMAPKLDVTNYNLKPEVTDLVVINPDTPVKMVQPKVIKPVFSIVIDPLQAKDAADIADVEAAIASVGGDITEIQPIRKAETTVVFVPYEEPPEVITSVRPEYPEFARNNHITGTVVLDVEVYKDGTVGNIVVFKPVYASLDAAAKAAVKQWKFEPGKSGGHPVNTIVRIPLEFSLTKD